MKTTVLGFSALMLGLFLVSCGNGETVGGDVGADALPDVGAIDNGDFDSAAEAEVEVERDVPVDLGPGDDVPPEPGEFGYPCNGAGDCNSGFCVESPNGRVCTRTCIEECPDNWTCKQVSIGGEPIFLCVPLFLTLCEPCKETRDCNLDLTGGNALCIDRGAGGKFCGGDCAVTGGRCPEGTTCTEVRDGTGGMSQQCVPVEGECPCSTRAITLGLSTDCFVSNSSGTCWGQRQCMLQGLTACDARTPRPEECNGIDDDCNGLTDELQGKFPCTRENEFGVCQGFGDCINGAIANCDARTATPELCNGIDDNCDGRTDEGLCEDGNPCTRDYCKAGTDECVHEPQAGPCDDLNPCTVNDYCDLNGNCMPGVFKSCDDGNPCTDDSCDPGTGQCIHLFNNAPCEDGNLCTQNDQCVNGTCRSGTPKDCSDDNICTLNERCDPSTGRCTFSPNDGAPCDDGNSCTLNDVCSGGQCIGPTDYCVAQQFVCTPVPPQIACAAPKCLKDPIIGSPWCFCACI